MNDFLRTQRLSGRRAAVLVTLVLIAACASNRPAPTASLGMARTAIGNAEKSEAGRYAAPELSEARQKLAAADNAVSEKNMLAAQRLADESRVEADFASAKSSEAKSTVVNDEMKRSNTVLIEEMQRKSGGQQ
jgi:hypothetical protein